MSTELLRLVTDFRKGILGKHDSESWCFMVCAPLEGFLPLWGYTAKLTDGHVCGLPHVWLTLPDGQIVDPTADQFKKPNGESMPPVYIGEKPEWYKPKLQEVIGG